MPAPFFTNNDSETTRLEGLYIQERNPPSAISGVFIGDVVVVSEAIRGPVDRAVLCSSATRVKEVFGGRDQGSGGATISPLWKTLSNKPFGRVFVVRAAAAAGATATLNIPAVTPVIKVDATSKGIWGNNVTAAIEDATDGVSTHFNLRVNYLGKDYLYRNINVNSASDNNLLAVIGTDDGNVVTVTKMSNGRPVNAVAASLTGGTEGSIADSDFTATGRGLNVAAAVPRCAVVWIGERMSAALKAAMFTLQASATDRVFLMGPNDETVSASTAITDVASYRSDRVIYCFNHAYTLDTETATEMLTRPESWLAAVISQTDVDIHPGEEDTKPFLAGITRLYHEEYQRGDYIAFKDAGICALEKDDGFAFVSGVTTSLVPGKEQYTRRRMTDYIQLSIANNLKHDAKKKATRLRRKQRVGKIKDFLETHKLNERVVEAYEVIGDVETDTEKGQGINRIRTRVRLISHDLFIILETEIGTQVKVVEQ